MADGGSKIGSKSGTNGCHSAAKTSASKACVKPAASAAKTTDSGFSSRANRISLNFQLGQLWGSATGKKDIAADAGKAHQAMHGGICGAGTDLPALREATANYTPAQMRQLAATYKKDYGRDFSQDVKAESLPADMSARIIQGQAQITLNDATKDMKVALKANSWIDAKTGHIDERADQNLVLNQLRNLNPQQRQALNANFAQNGSSLSKELCAKLEGEKLLEAGALMTGNKAKADAVRLHASLGADKAQVFAVLGGQTPDSMKALKKEYAQQYGHQAAVDTDAALRFDDERKARLLLKQGQLKPAQQLEFAMKGVGSNVGEVKQVLAQLDAKGLAQASKQLKSATGTDLAGWVGSQWMSHTDKVELEQLQRGPAAGVGQNVMRSLELNDAGRGSVWGIGKCVSGLLSDNGTVNDKARYRLQAQIDQIGKNRNNSAFGYAHDMKAELPKLMENAALLKRTSNAFVETSNAQASLLSTAAGLVVAAPVEGVAGPAVAAWTGLGVTASTKKALSGNNYQNRDLAIDVALTASGLQTQKLASQAISNSSAAGLTSEVFNGAVETTVTQNGEASQYADSTQTSLGKVGVNHGWTKVLAH
jgi:hypothetical protein